MSTTTNETILLWGPATDPELMSVENALRGMGFPVTLLDQSAIRDTCIELEATASAEGAITIGDEGIELASVRAFYLRPGDPGDFVVPGADESSRLWKHAIEVQDMLFSWAEIAPIIVLNRPSAMAANTSKPYQASWIESLGLQTPPTLITTDRDAAYDFWREHGEVIYKSLSSTRSIVSRLTSEHLCRLGDISTCPTQFQKYIPGIDYRVHVIGNNVFGCRISSVSDDYRYSGAVQMESCELPDDLTALCRKLASAMNLLIAGIDLRCTPQGRWYCFEVNPSPGFTFFQEITGQPISAAVAQLLASALVH